MSRTIESYLADLKAQLAGCDPATVQDALADAEDHLTSALHQTLRDRPDANPVEVLNGAIEQFGTVEEVAKAYREMEVRTPPGFAAPRREERSWFARFGRVLGDPRAYGALLYMLTSVITGCLFFVWTVTGISLSLGLMVLIFGIPFFGLFVFSIQGLALVEGRIVEALLGVRMPRRQVPLRGGKGLWGKFTARLRDRRTWTTILYFILRLPLGVLYFTLFVVLLAYSLNLMALPILQYALGEGLIVIGSTHYQVPGWTMPILIAAGVLDVIVLLHLARIVGKWHGALAKALLVQR
jgi:hypothetical protein